MKCYFCQNELEPAKDQQGHVRKDSWESCNYCTSTHGLYSVITTANEDGQYLYAHMYPEERKYMAISRGSVGRFLLTPWYVPCNTTYHIRLNVKEDTTDIMVTASTDILLHLPGLNMKPSNVKEKLKLYLLFS